MSNTDNQTGSERKWPSTLAPDLCWVYPMEWEWDLDAKTFTARQSDTPVMVGKLTPFSEAARDAAWLRTRGNGEDAWDLFWEVIQGPCHVCGIPTLNKPDNVGLRLCTDHLLKVLEAGALGAGGLVQILSGWRPGSWQPEAFLNREVLRSKSDRISSLLREARRLFGDERPGVGPAALLARLLLTAWPPADWEWSDQGPALLLERLLAAGDLCLNHVPQAPPTPRRWGALPVSEMVRHQARVEDAPLIPGLPACDIRDQDYPSVKGDEGGSASQTDWDWGLKDLVYRPLKSPDDKIPIEVFRRSCWFKADRRFAQALSRLRLDCAAGRRVNVASAARDHGIDRKTLAYEYQFFSRLEGELTQLVFKAPMGVRRGAICVETSSTRS